MFCARFSFSIIGANLSIWRNGGRTCFLTLAKFSATIVKCRHLQFIALMATKDEIKSLLEAEIGPLKAKLTSIEKSFFELEKSVKHFSAKYDELLKQVQRSYDRTASLSTDVKNLKEDMKQCKKIGREIEDLSQYLRRDCLELTGVLPTVLSYRHVL